MNEMSLRPRPGETPELTVARVVAAAKEKSASIDEDERDRERERYAVYAMIGGDLRRLAAAPGPEGLGQAIVALGADARAAGEEPDVIAVLDRVERRWLTGWPWTKSNEPEGRRRREPRCGDSRLLAKGERRPSSSIRRAGEGSAILIVVVYPYRGGTPMSKNEPFEPFEVSPETALVNDFASRAEEEARITSPDFVPAFDPAPREARCPAWSIDRRGVGCTRERGHSGAHANHTIEGWSFVHAASVENREDWVAYVDEWFPQ